MRRSLQTCFALLLVLAVSVPAAAEQPAPRQAKAVPEYRITVIPYYSPEKIWARFTPFIEYLRRATGLPWELKLYHDHETLLAGLCGGEVSLALLGPVPLGRAIDTCKAGIIAVALGKDGKSFYHSLIVTGDPAVSSLDGLKGRRFGLFKGSTAAHIVPLKMLRDAGLKESEIVPVFYESQDRIMNALLSREVHGAGVKDALYQKFAGEGLSVLKASGPLPNFAFAAAPSLREATRKRFADALLRLNPRSAQQDRQLMQDWDDEIKNGFIAPPAGYRRTVLDILTVYREIVHEDR